MKYILCIWFSKTVVEVCQNHGVAKLNKNICWEIYLTELIRALDTLHDTWPIKICITYDT